MTLDAVLDKIEAIIEGTHYGASPLEMGHCEYCTTWLVITQMEL